MFVLCLTLTRSLKSLSWRVEGVERLEVMAELEGFKLKKNFRVLKYTILGNS